MVPVEVRPSGQRAGAAGLVGCSRPQEGCKKLCGGQGHRRPKGLVAPCRMAGRNGPAQILLGRPGKGATRYGLAAPGPPAVRRPLEAVVETSPVARGRRGPRTRRWRLAPPCSTARQRAFAPLQRKAGRQSRGEPPGRCPSTRGSPNRQPAVHGRRGARLAHCPATRFGLAQIRPDPLARSAAAAAVAAAAADERGGCAAGSAGVRNLLGQGSAGRHVGRLAGPDERRRSQSAGTEAEAGGQAVQDGHKGGRPSVNSARPAPDTNLPAAADPPVAEKSGAVAAHWRETVAGYFVS